MNVQTAKCSSGCPSLDLFCSLLSFPWEKVTDATPAVQRAAVCPYKVTGVVWTFAWQAAPLSLQMRGAASTRHDRGVVLVLPSIWTAPPGLVCRAHLLHRESLEKQSLVTTSIRGHKQKQTSVRPLPVCPDESSFPFVLDTFTALLAGTHHCCLAVVQRSLSICALLFSPLPGWVMKLSGRPQPLALWMAELLQ